jgi:uncharacterized protein (TIGR00159 family)
MLTENISIKDIIDLALVVFCIYQVYRMMRKSGSMAVFTGVIAFIAVWILISQVFRLPIMGAILDRLVSVGVLVLVIIFQDEIRRFLFTLGSHRGWRFLDKLFKSKQELKGEKKYVAPVVLACMNMARKNTGALIVIQQETPLDMYEQTGEMFRAEPNTRLIENIFFKNSPLHDGALIIADDMIHAAACILPVAQHVSLPKEFGLRHRAALGLSMETDAIIIVVSEERGRISVAHNAELTADISADELRQILAG